MCTYIIICTNGSQLSITTALVTKSGDTLPHIAVSKGDLPTIEYLVRECGIKVNGECNFYILTLSCKIKKNHLATSLICSCKTRMASVVNTASYIAVPV